jgi:hypothetical protein
LASSQANQGGKGRGVAPGLHPDGIFPPTTRCHVSTPHTPHPHLLPPSPPAAGPWPATQKSQVENPPHPAPTRPGPPVSDSVTPSLVSQSAAPATERSTNWRRKGENKGTGKKALAFARRRQRRCLSLRLRRTAAAAVPLATTGSSTAASSTTSRPRHAGPSRGTRPRRHPTRGQPDDRSNPPPLPLLLVPRCGRFV